MRLSGRFLVLMNVIGDIGAIVAAIKFWGDNRTLSIVAIATAIAIFLLPPTISSLGVFVGIGLFAYAIAENGLIAVLSGAIGAAASVVLLGREKLHAEQEQAEQQLEEVSSALSRMRRIQNESQQLDPATPRQHAHIAAAAVAARPTAENPFALPLESYAPILHRGLTLAAESMGRANEEEFRALQLAAGRLQNFRPIDPALADLHDAAAAYVLAMFRYCDTVDQVSRTVFRSDSRSQAEELREKERQWEKATQAHLEQLQSAIYDIYSDKRRPLFDRLGFSVHELTYLYLDDIVDDMEAADAAIIEEPEICEVCGAEVQYDESYCSECGTPRGVPF